MLADPNSILAEIQRLEAKLTKLAGAVANAGLGNAFVQNGNSFGTDATLGTNDPNDVFVVAGGASTQVGSRAIRLFSGGGLITAPALGPGPGTAGLAAFILGTNFGLFATGNSNVVVTGGNLTVGTVSSGTLHLSGAGAVTVAAASGSVDIDATTTVGLASSTATGVIIGNSTTTASFQLAGTAATHQTTVGASGAASNTPAAPQEYLKITYNGNLRVIPLYLQA